jgi:hypothetical protein
MNNYLDDSAIQYIGNHLPQLDGLESLNITANRFGDHGASSLLVGLKANYVLTHLEMPRGFDVEDKICYFMSLNQGGRRLLEKKLWNDVILAAIPTKLGVWPLVFERINLLPLDILSVSVRGSVVYFFLQQGPVLVAIYA